METLNKKNSRLFVTHFNSICIFINKKKGKRKNS